MKQNLIKWNEWFAGITDGNGCFYIEKAKNFDIAPSSKNNQKKNINLPREDIRMISFEITMHIKNWQVIYDIKNILKTGSIKFRSNRQSIRYRIKQQAKIIEIVHRLNGKLYNKTRLAQFHKVCQMLKIQQINSSYSITKKNAYLSGLIDSNGIIVITVSKSSQEDSQKSGIEGKIQRLTNSKNSNQLTLKITSIDCDALILIRDSYGFGTIYEEKINKKNNSSQTKYHWVVRSFKDFTMLYNYLKNCPVKSVKRHRIRLSILYFQYKKLKYHFQPPDTLEAKKWSQFCKSWFKY